MSFFFFFLFFFGKLSGTLVNRTEMCLRELVDRNTESLTAVGSKVSRHTCEIANKL